MSPIGPQISVLMPIRAGGMTTEIVHPARSEAATLKGMMI
jgi:hypothetical protein